jgi:ribosomal protein S18 acetylase RimI-like enzyme
MRVAAPTSLHIRKRRRAADDEFIVRLAVQAFAEYDRQPEVTMERLVERGTTWLALRGDTPLGFACVQSFKQGCVELCAIAVEEDARGQGIGRALLAHVELAAASAGQNEIRLHTAQSNLSAFELFLECGFRLERRMPRFYRGVYDACVLTKIVGSRGAR